MNAETKGMNINQRFDHYLAQGWTYIPDPKTWSGGVWYNDKLGSVNNSGGTFPNITRAVEAMDRHYQNWELLQQ